MDIPGPPYLGCVYLFSEVLLTVTRRSRGDGKRQDKSTLGVLWLVIILSVLAGLFVAARVPAGALPSREVWRLVGLIVFVLGLALRWWAIVVLGRFFTVDVQIAQDHELVERGPFRLVRHPSYTGVLLGFVGFAFSLANWMAMLVLLVPIFLALFRRMQVEEDALSAALGEKYASYMRRTKRLLPGIY